MPRKISRRTFFKTGAAVAAASVLAGCEQYTRYVTIEPYVVPPEEQLTGIPTYYASTCRMCPAGCGIIVRVMNGRALKIEGNPEHPLNRGKLCARGQAGLQLLYNPDRVRGPLAQAKRGSGALGANPLPWDQAIDELARQLQAAGNKLAIWVGPATSGHLLDLFGRIAKAAGAPAPVVYAPGSEGQQMLISTSQRVFGRSAMPAYEISRADVVLSFSADILGTEQSPTRYGIEYGNFRTQAKGLRGHLIQFETRQSITGSKADNWYPIRPGTDGLVALAIARLMVDQPGVPADRVGRARTMAGSFNVDDAIKAADVPMEALVNAAQVFGAAQHPVAIPGAALAQTPNGADAMAAVQMLNVVAGTAGQPGGLLLDADLPSPAPVRTAVSPFADVQNLLNNLRGGGVQMLMIYGFNPAHELPASLGLADALNKVAFVVSFGSLEDETALQANLVLPDRTYLESWGYSVVSPNFGTPIVSSQQPVVSATVAIPAVDARATGDVLLTAAKRAPALAGALTWNDEVAFIKDTITQLPAGAAGGSGADLLWSRFQQHGGWWPASAAPAAVNATTGAAPTLNAPQYQGSATEFPYLLQVYESTLLGRGEGANLPWLQGSPDPMTTIAWQSWVEINPETAQKLGVSYGDVVRVTSPNGSIEAPVYVYPVIRPDAIGLPLGQGHAHFGRYADNRGANATALLGPTPDNWATVRVKVERTGQRVNQSKFEWTEGVNQGFPTDVIPGSAIGG